MLVNVPPPMPVMWTMVTVITQPGELQAARRQQPADQPAEQRPQPASGKDSWRRYALLDDWRGKMAAPEEPELSQAQTEKLLQFQVDNLTSTLTRVRLKPHVSIRYCCCWITANRRNSACLNAFCTFNSDNVSRQLESKLTLAEVANVSSAS